MKIQIVADINAVECEFYDKKKCKAVWIDEYMKCDLGDCCFECKDLFVCKSPCLILDNDILYTLKYKKYKE